MNRFKVLLIVILMTNYLMLNGQSLCFTVDSASIYYVSLNINPRISLSDYDVVNSRIRKKICVSDKDILKSLIDTQALIIDDKCKQEEPYLDTRIVIYLYHKNKIIMSIRMNASAFYLIDDEYFYQRNQNFINWVSQYIEDIK